MIATDYGVPQTRDRAFIVSIKGEYSYTFPKPFKLQKRLKDYLETKVDEKYYLSDKQIEQIANWKAYNKPLENAKSENDETIQTITAKSNTSMNSSMVLIKEATRIRKLTPLEAWRLMGINDEDFHKAKATGMSDSQLYKQAGNAIVVDVLYYIFKQFIKGERK